MSDYKRLTKQAGWHKNIDLKDELGYSYIYQRLAELENKIEQGTLKEVPENAVVLAGVSFQDNEGKTLFTDGDWKFSEQLTPITVTSKEPLAEEDYENAKILCMKHCEFLPKCQEQTRKKTAEKFAKRLKEDVSKDNELHERLNYYLKRDYFEYIDEICKKITEV